MKVISGGPGTGPDVAPPIRRYRSGPKLESFMRDCGVLITIGSSSRLPVLSEAVLTVLRSGDANIMRTIIEKAADPRDFVTKPRKVPQVTSDLNHFLAYDGLELPHQGQRVRLVQAGTSAPVLAALAQKTQKNADVHVDLCSKAGAVRSLAGRTLRAAALGIDAVNRAIGRQPRQGSSGRLGR